MKIPKVRNMISPKTGKPVNNQFIIYDGIKVIFQSYNKTIALYENTELTLDINALHYSKTTSLYLYTFLGLSMQEIKLAIKEGYIEELNLNIDPKNKTYDPQEQVQRSLKSLITNGPY